MGRINVAGGVLGPDLEEPLAGRGHRDGAEARSPRSGGRMLGATGGSIKRTDGVMSARDRGDLSARVTPRDPKGIVRVPAVAAINSETRRSRRSRVVNDKRARNRPTLVTSRV